MFVYIYIIYLNGYFRKKYVEPNANEGFSVLQKIKFVPEFSDKKNETLYFQHLLENSRRK